MYCSGNSRAFSDYGLMRDRCDVLLSNKMGTHDVVIISGTALGADRMGERYAANRGLKTMMFKPDWEQFGKKAGFIRNALMLDNADAVVVFWDGSSRGSQHMMTIAKNKGTPLRVILF